MKVDPDKKYLFLYSVNPDTEIGVLVEPYVVQLNDNDTLSLTVQKLYHNTMDAFSSSLDENDKEAIRLTSEYSFEAITKNFSKKKDLRPQEFFEKYVKDDVLKLIRTYVEERITKVMELTGGKPIYMRVKTNPAQYELQVIPQKVSTHFHFKKSDEGTTYYPTFKLGEEKLALVNKNPIKITNQPCRIVMDDCLYTFDESMDGQKLTPFFTKWNIQIPKTAEAEYYRRFICTVIENDRKVLAEGFEIKDRNTAPVPLLSMSVNKHQDAYFNLYFDYGKTRISPQDKKEIHVVIEEVKDSFTYHKVRRHFTSEKKLADSLDEIGLKLFDGISYIPLNGHVKYTRQQLISWVNEHHNELKKLGVRIEQDTAKNGYFMGSISMNFSISEKTDWFDIKAVAQFGDFSIPFIRLKKFITQGIHEFPLPDGSIAIIPEEWFGKYREVLSLSLDEEGETISLKKHHFALIDEVFKSQDTSKSSIEEYEKKSRQLRQEEEENIPVSFNDILRPYQQEGYRWFKFLKKNNFGGCLADDMGLGKTIQTLALLLSEKEENKTDKETADLAPHRMDLFAHEPEETLKKLPSMIVMPTSLIHNWEVEIKKFAPELKAVSYAGLMREEKIKSFRSADIILTTYGTCRNDIDILNNYEYNYLILDESQVIKNPASKISREVKTLKSRHRITLTGTPIENSLIDLWSQLSFLNPGMLGGYQYFKDEFVIPIEKKNSDEHKKKLQSLIRPFILRRTKEEVAADLPELSEKIYYSEMTQQQKEVYDETRNYYRSRILENIEKFGEHKSQFFILKGLMQLRLIANHPRMNNASYEGDSGKFTDIMSTLEEILKGNHKILVFSQFVRHLDLLKAALIRQDIPYSYLTGATTMRKEEINRFKSDDDIKIFLMSLKAGGVGLNLTEADYIFLADPWWNPAAEMQAVNRAHRIGQNKNVFAYKFISKDTVEEKIINLQERKLRLSADFIHTTHRVQEGLISADEVKLLFS